MTILAMDVGDVRTGVALSDPTETIAFPLKIIDARKENLSLEIKNLIKSYNVKKVIYGLPISLDGTEKRQAEKVRTFVKSLEDEVKDVEFIAIDERFSTKSAQRVVNELGKKRSLDSISASIILQTYLNSVKR